MSLTDPTYLALIASADAPGVVGHPDPRAANTRRAAVHGSAQIDAPRWTNRRLQTWREHAVDRLDTALLQPATSLDQPIDRARAVLALADTAVRDAWLIRYGNADPAAQSRAADRLADLAADAPADYRVPVGTILALTEWTQGRAEAATHLADATRDLSKPYTLAALLEGMIRGDIHPRDFMTNVLGALTEAECLDPQRSGPRAARTVTAAAQTMTDRGWALHIEHQTDLGHTQAWSGTLTHDGAPAAHIADHGDGTRMRVHWPHGSQQQRHWAHDLTSAGITPDLALAGLEHTATVTLDPLGVDAHPATDLRPTTATAHR
jgi:hypothetical protein